MVLSMDRWKGKIAVVTGASEGIGAAITIALVHHRVTVVGFARRKEKIEELPVDDPSKLHAVKVDVTNEKSILEGFKWVKENLGPVHILINNAGILPNSDLSDGDTDSWRRTLDTNVLGLCIATREAFKQMQENDIAGHIVHINSIAGHGNFTGYFPGLSVYPASKHAVTALTETLRQELNAKGSKVKVTSISPGYVKTAIAQNAGMEIPDEILARYKDIGCESEDVADATIYVLSTPPHVQVHELMVQPIGQP